MAKVRLICPFCKTEEEHEIDEKNIWTCSCGESIQLKCIKEKCPVCNKVTSMWIPEDNQIYFIHQSDYPCTKNDCYQYPCRKEIWLKCKYYLKQPNHISDIESECICENPECGIPFCVEHFKGNRSFKYAKLPFFGSLVEVYYRGFYRFTSRHFGDARNYLGPGQIRLVADLSFFIIWGFLFGFLPRLIIFSITDHKDLMNRDYYIITSILLGIILFFYYKMLQEIGRIAGEVEILLRRNYSYYVDEVISLFTQKKIFLFSYIALFILYFYSDYSIVGSDFSHPIWIAKLASLFELIPIAIALQMIGAYGFFLFFIYSSSTFRPFKKNTTKALVNVIEKNAEMSLRLLFGTVVLFHLIMAQLSLFGSDILITYYESTETTAMGSFWRFGAPFLVGGVPFIIYSIYLRRSLSLVKYQGLEELRNQIDKIRENDEEYTIEKAREISYLSEEETKLKRSGRGIIVLDVIGRIIVAVTLGLGGFLLFQGL